MKMKKLVAIGAAAAMSMAMCVNAFAAITVSSENSKFGSYADGVAKLADVSAIDATHQWTVVIIDAEKENSNLQASDLYYINQGTSAEGFWVTNGMGTKVDLTTLVNETTTEKNFIIRIGGETITDSQGIIDIPFTITYTSDASNDRVSVEFKCCDINGDGNVTLSDITNFVSAYLGGNKTFTNSTTQDVFTYNESTIVGTDGTYTFSNGYKWCDINGDGNVNLTDITNLLSAYLGGNKQFSGSKFGTTYTYNESTITMSITK